MIASVLFKGGAKHETIFLIVGLFTHQNLRIVKSQKKIESIFLKIKILANLRIFFYNGKIEKSLFL
jgi:hypothetical protein